MPKRFHDKVADKLERAFARLAITCQYTPAEGEPHIRLVDLPRTHKDTSQEYAPQPVTLAEFLLNHGHVEAGDTFQHGVVDDNGQFQPRGKVCRLTQVYHADNFSVTYTYVEH